MNKSYGSPFDRGSADYFYYRTPKPHWYPEGTGRGGRVESLDMTPEQIAEYWAGWEESEKMNDRKEWN